MLELMRGNLARAIEAGPLDLDALRLALGCCLSALHFLHGNGVIHGDVKPSNMLVDAQGRVKLGDFGLARRASSEQGSLLKGTTKYMAPELVSSQFGPVGPASDLYSLGFSAYELLCGPQFDSLFPGLGTFGRDRQIAWLLWHAAPDRHLPPIARVLEGVPPDLAHVIERLAAKDQAQRYHSAAEVLEDLRAGRALAAGESLPAAPPTPPAGPKKRLTRIVAIAAMACSVLLSVLMLLPGSPERPRKELRDIEGVVVTVDADNRKMVVESSADGSRVERVFTPGDRFQLNFKPSFLRNLKAGDRVKIETAADEEGRQVALVYATRAERLEGRIRTIDPEAEKLVVSFGPGENQELEILAPKTARITFNGKAVFERRPAEAADARTTWGRRAARRSRSRPSAKSSSRGRSARSMSPQARWPSTWASRPAGNW
ncbi:MAG: serine/threonine protein kinase [Thermoguttaceae bacterium]|nr:serine/threonine protein kinase [Thermoguttaceae bacterium]